MFNIHMIIRRMVELYLRRNESFNQSNSVVSENSLYHISIWLARQCVCACMFIQYVQYVCVLAH